MLQTNIAKTPIQSLNFQELQVTSHVFQAFFGIFYSEICKIIFLEVFLNKLQYEKKKAFSKGWCKESWSVLNKIMKFY